MGKSTQIASKASQRHSSESYPLSAPIAPTGSLSPARGAHRGHTEEFCTTMKEKNHAQQANC